MYTPKHFEETRTEVMHQLVRAHPLCTLVTLSDDGLLANYIPMLLRPQDGTLGTLVGHVARANSVWRATNFEVPVLALFQGPQHYISPSLYATKAEHGKVVPTWNYAVVQARGRLTVHDDADWVRQQVTELTQQQEAARAKPWAVSDAPRDYTDTMIKAIVGIEIALTQLSGKWKVSQNQVLANQDSLVQALQQGNADNQAMAQLVRSFAPGRSNPA
ncbi:MAG: FMN-binding negative transcriptional regulator [Burkholderiales bacterium]|nr:FMN-binding negative transcriptional regulator [Burkholderiales bacterium]